MRTANGRDPETGDGDSNGSWIGWSIAMIVLDTLSGDSKHDVEKRWLRLLTDHGVSEDDAAIIYQLRCSLLHGYGLPGRGEAGGRQVVVDDGGVYAVDTREDGFALVSVPVFCARLVERIASEAPNDWDVSRIDVDFRFDISRLG
jgi:hypothetical protein